MAGFCLEIRADETAARGAAPRPVDLGGSDVEQAFSWGAARLAWSFRGESRQWWTRDQGERLLLIEGQPDRYPRDGESLQDWLAGGRWGSYRGFEIQRPQAQPSGSHTPARPLVTAFVDPLGTRPLYVQRTAEFLLLSDKLSTIALHASPAAELHWPALLESIALGSLYSPDTTLRGVEELAPGESIEFHGVEERRRKRHAMPAADLDSRQVHSDPSGTLLSAMKQAVAETWTDQQTALLLSGGLDSRLVLALAGPGRKAITVQLYDGETGIAQQVAACCDAELRVFPYLPSDTLHSVSLATAAAGATHDPHFFNHLGMGPRWRSGGVTAVAHAYLFDTLLKGYFLLPCGAVPHSALTHSMPRTAKFFERISGRGSHVAAADAMGLLNPRGREALHTRLAALDAGMAVTAEGALDLTFENCVLGRISRQVHYGTFLGWCEEMDVSSPIFHPALWSWRSLSRAADRHNGRAFTAMLVSLDHAVVKVVDANTGVAPRVPEISWRDSIRHNGFYQRFLQPVWKTLRGAKDDVSFDSGLGVHFREPAAMRFLTRWAREIGDSEWFDAAAIESYAEKFKAGEERYLEPLLACASAARWQRIVREKSIAEPD